MRYVTQSHPHNYFIQQWSTPTGYTLHTHVRHQDNNPVVFVDHDNVGPQMKILLPHNWTTDVLHFSFYWTYKLVTLPLILSLRTPDSVIDLPPAIIVSPWELGRIDYTMTLPSEMSPNMIFPLTIRSKNGVPFYLLSTYVETD